MTVVVTLLQIQDLHLEAIDFVVEQNNIYAQPTTVQVQQNMK
ncbi:MAG: hypothetical protein SOV48_16595 [Intestinibacter sp.]|nr:hypothetical protein [Intestinibacter sp.]